MNLRVASTVGSNTSLAVKPDVFGAPVNSTLIAQAVRVYLSNQRQGTSKVKTRSEVARTKKKWFKQKGTGNARHGARTPNIFVGGGVAHGPTGNQNFTLKMSTTMKHRALVSALSAQVKNIIVCDDINQLDGKTASAQKMLNKMLPDAERILVIVPQPTGLVMRSLRNIEYVLVTSANRLNTYELVLADAVVMTKDAVKFLEEKLTTDGKAEKKVKTAKPEVKAEKAVKPVAKKAAAKAEKPAKKEVKKATKKVSK